MFLQLQLHVHTVLHKNLLKLIQVCGVKMSKKLSSFGFKMLLIFLKTLHSVLWHVLSLSNPAKVAELNSLFFTCTECSVAVMPIL